MSQRIGETDVEYLNRRRENTLTIFEGIMDDLKSLIKAGETGEKLKTIEDFKKNK